jgi:hypothetical protein
MRTAFLLLLAPAKGNSTRQNSVAAGDSASTQHTDTAAQLLSPPAVVPKRAAVSGHHLKHDAAPIDVQRAAAAPVDGCAAASSTAAGGCRPHQPGRCRGAAPPPPYRFGRPGSGADVEGGTVRTAACGGPPLEGTPCATPVPRWYPPGCRLAPQLPQQAGRALSTLPHLLDAVQSAARAQQ